MWPAGAGRRPSSGDALGRRSLPFQGPFARGFLGLEVCERHGVGAKPEAQADRIGHSDTTSQTHEGILASNPEGACSWGDASHTDAPCGQTGPESVQSATSQHLRTSLVWRRREARASLRDWPDETHSSPGRGHGAAPLGLRSVARDHRPHGRSRRPRRGLGCRPGPRRAPRAGFAGPAHQRRPPARLPRGAAGSPALRARHPEGRAAAGRRWRSTRASTTGPASSSW